MNQEITYKLRWDDNMVTQDAYQGLMSEYADKDVEFECVNNILSITGPEETVYEIVSDLQTSYEEYGLPYIVEDDDVEPEIEDEDDNIDYPDAYIYDDPENPTWSEKKIVDAKKLLESHGYNIVKDLTPRFKMAARKVLQKGLGINEVTEDDYDVNKYMSAQQKLIQNGAAIDGENSVEPMSRESEIEYGKKFANKTRLMRAILSPEFKFQMNQKYGYPPRELAAIVAQMVEDMQTWTDVNTSSIEEIRQYIEENLP